MKKASIVLFVIATFATGCEFLAEPGSVNPDFELCLQDGFTPCTPSTFNEYKTN